MHRFFIEQKPVNNSILISDAEQLHHIREVLRLKIGDDITVFDGAGNEYLCAIQKLDKKQALLAIKERNLSVRKPVSVTIACAIPKQTRMDDIVDKLTQLGIDVIIPMETERVIVRLDEKKKAARLLHWRKIARSAAQQSQRSSIPLVEPVSSLRDVLTRSPDFDLKLIPTLAGEKKHLREVLADARPHSILVLIGPEGDFTPEEVELAQSEGFLPVSLGNNVLRVDTAAIGVASYFSLTLT